MGHVCVENIVEVLCFTSSEVDKIPGSVKPGGMVEAIFLCVVFCCRFVHGDESKCFGMYEGQNIQSLDIKFRNIYSASRLGIVNGRETGMILFSFKIA